MFRSPRTPFTGVGVPMRVQVGIKLSGEEGLTCRQCSNTLTSLQTKMGMLAYWRVTEQQLMHYSKLVEERKTLPPCKWRQLQRCQMHLPALPLQPRSPCRHPQPPAITLLILKSCNSFDSVEVVRNRSLEHTCYTRASEHATWTMCHQLNDG